MKYVPGYMHQSVKMLYSQDFDRRISSIEYVVTHQHSRQFCFEIERWGASRPLHRIKTKTYLHNHTFSTVWSSSPQYFISAYVHSHHYFLRFGYYPRMRTTMTFILSTRRSLTARQLCQRPIHQQLSTQSHEEARRFMCEIGDTISLMKSG